MKEFETILFEELENGIGIITFNREHVANAFNTKTLHEMLKLFLPWARETGNLRCLILTGAGNRIICAGADLKERNGMNSDTWHRQHRLGEQMFQAVMDCPIPIIAAVNGAAMGGGCEIALCCDFIIAADNARFALPETKRGIFPGGGGTQNLKHAVGLPRAKQMIFTGEAISATTAEQWELANSVVLADELRAESMKIAHQIATNGP